MKIEFDEKVYVMIEIISKELKISKNVNLARVYFQIRSKLSSMWSHSYAIYKTEERRGQEG